MLQGTKSPAKIIITTQYFLSKIKKIMIQLCT